MAEFFGIYAEMRFEEIIDAVKTGLIESGLNPHQAAVRAGLPQDAIRSVVLHHHEPRAARLSEICRALELEFYIGPKRDDRDFRVTSLKSPLRSTSENERDLAEMIQTITEAWEAGDERDRGDICGRFSLAFYKEISARRLSARNLKHQMVG